jgi:Fic family protein
MPGNLIRRTWKYDPTMDAPPRYRRACHYESFVPDEIASLDVSLEAGLAGHVAEAEHAVRSLNDEGGPALGPLARLLLRTESIASSKVEGLQLGVRELARAEARAETGGKPGPDALEVLANIDSMSLAVEKAAVVPEFTVAEIRNIHHRLMVAGPHRLAAGMLRTGQNWIGGNDYNPCGADFVPPPPEEVDRLVVDLCAAVRDSEFSPLVQAAIVHAQFETIHPFDDGNGRTGRALVHVVLRRRRLAPRFLPPVSVIFARDRDRYIDGLGRFRGTEVTQWIEQFASATWAAARLASSYVASVRELQEDWRARLGALPNAPRADSAAWALIDALPAHPIVSAPVAAAAVRHSKVAIYDAISRLTDAGVLQPLSDSARNRSWEATGLLPLIAALEAGELPQ